MSLLKNTKLYQKDKNTNFQVCEAELHIYNEITGEFQLGPYHLMIVDFDNPRKRLGELRRLCLRAKIYDEVDQNGEPVINPSKTDPFSDFTASAALFLRSKIKLIRMTRRDDRPVNIPLKFNFLHKPLLAGDRDLTSMSKYFNKLLALDEISYAKFITSVHMYHAALQMIKEDVNIASLLLVSSVETLSNSHKFEKAEISRSGIKKKFKKFIIDYLPNDFWDYSESKDNYAKIKKTDLGNYLNRIYDYRCLMLHHGISLFEKHNECLEKENWDIEAGWPTVFGEIAKEIPENLKKTYNTRGNIQSHITLKQIPSIIWFERLVNSVLKNYLLKI